MNYRGSLTLALAASFIVSGCHYSKVQGTAEPTDAGHGYGRVIREVAVGPGTACYVDGVTGPPSFLVRDLGKRGVPQVTTDALRMARKIAMYVRAKKTLRFAYVGGEFIVFNAVDGACEPNAPGYSVLNGKCNEMYSPTDNFDHTRAVPDCNGNLPRPWMADERTQPAKATPKSSERPRK